MEVYLIFLELEKMVLRPWPLLQCVEFIHIHFLYEINHMGPYISLLWRAAKMVFHVSLRYDACEPQIRVRASGTLYVAEEEETFVTRKQIRHADIQQPSFSSPSIMYAFLRPIVH